MRSMIIRPNEAGQRLDKFLHKYMKEAPGSFFYKMMRKKNIVLNGAKCTGAEKLSEGDEVKFFMAEETLEKFGAPQNQKEKVSTAEYERAFKAMGALDIVYEDAHVLAVNKPAGVLTQKAQPKDLSLNEWLIGYLLSQKAVSAEELATFKPSVCNRLDRNTSGLVLCSKSLEGSQVLTRLIRERQIGKFYRLVVCGTLTIEGVQEAWLVKDQKTNQVKIFKQETAGADYVKTGIHPIRTALLTGIGPVTYAEAELFTGKTHQIRAHLSSLGYPLLGDTKYGDHKLIEGCQKYGIKNQLLHACRVEFPTKLPEHFEGLAGKRIIAELPEEFARILEAM